MAQMVRGVIVSTALVVDRLENAVLANVNLSENDEIISAELKSGGLGQTASGMHDGEFKSSIPGGLYSKISKTPDTPITLNKGEIFDKSGAKIFGSSHSCLKNVRVVNTEVTGGVLAGINHSDQQYFDPDDLLWTCHL